MGTPEINTLFLALEAHINQKKKCEGAFNGTPCTIYQYDISNKGTILMVQFRDNNYRYTLECTSDKVAGEKNPNKALPDEVVLNNDQWEIASAARRVKLSADEVAHFLDQIATNFKPN